MRERVLQVDAVGIMELQVEHNDELIAESDDIGFCLALIGHLDIRHKMISSRAFLDFLDTIKGRGDHVEHSLFGHVQICVVAQKVSAGESGRLVDNAVTIPVCAIVIGIRGQRETIWQRELHPAVVFNRFRRCARTEGQQQGHEQSKNLFHEIPP